MTPSNRRLVECALASLLSSAPVFAQSVSTASIGGTVRDGSGGVLPGVTVTAMQSATGFTRTVVSDETGGYTITTLPIGPYRMEFMLQGFQARNRSNGAC